MNVQRVVDVYRARSRSYRIKAERSDEAGQKMQAAAHRGKASAYNEAATTLAAEIRRSAA